MSIQRSINCTISILLLAFFAVCPGTCIAQLHRAAENSEAACPGDTVDKLGPQVAKESRSFVAKLKAATDADDRTAVSSMLRYPLAVNVGDKTFRVHTPEEFLRNYDRIMNRTVRGAIDDPQSSRCLFFSPQGFMIGDGEIWFRQMSAGVYKVITVNLD